MTYAHPGYFFLLLLLIPMIAWYIWRNKKTSASLQISSIGSFEGIKKSYKVYLLHLPFLLRLGAVTVIIFALARPQSSDNHSNKNVEGINIMMALDISESMQAEDLTPTRLDAAKNVGKEFILSRVNDNIGLVVFAGESFTQSPLTTDKTSLIRLLDGVDSDMMEDKGTAIGLGIANAVNRIKDVEAKSKVIILLTDGSNNRGEIDPMTAADLAATYKIKVYTIGVGTNVGEAPIRIKTAMGYQKYMMPVEIDETTLDNIAKKTGGRYFRATDNKSLKAIYEEIDKLEKTKIQVTEYCKKNEEYLPFAIAALVLLLLEILLRNTLLRHIP
ncbi:MAG: VWA domain-containing protein [Paludibacteraceae bacterium]|nr:VWA domain-containing protein [Paludibacteraceae bacterium]